MMSGFLVLGIMSLPVYKDRGIKKSVQEASGIVFHPKMCFFYIHINTVERMMTTSVNSSWSYNNKG